jgi:putative nucleotidyltransferase with HDIG domain
MKIEKTLLKSKVARRVFVLFISCALVPIVVLAIVSFSQVRQQLYEQSKRRLHQSSKALGMSVIERLSFLENELKIFSSRLDGNPGASMENTGQEYSESLEERFKGLSLIARSGRSIHLFGHSNTPVEQSEPEKQHIRSGKTLVVTHFNEDDRSHIYMMRAVDPQNPERGILYGEVNSMYLWGLGEHDTLPSMTELSVLDRKKNLMYSTIPLPSSFNKRSELRRRKSSSGNFMWKYEDKEYMASFWNIFLKFNYLYPKWTIVLSVTKEHIFAPMAFFRKLFPLVILLSFWVVLLLSFIQIRRTMLPLETLKDGTRRIAMRDFESRVKVVSGDEFEELGSSFNDMATQLGRQFNALTTMAEIDRAILSALETEKIVNTVISRMQEFFGYDFVSVTLLDPTGEPPMRTYTQGEDLYSTKRFNAVKTTPEDFENLIDNQEIQLIPVNKDLPLFLAPFVTGGINYLALLPLLIKRKLVGVITVGSRDSSEPEQEDLLQARQLSDQVAVALSNAQLIEDLDELNWGALTALARAVDEKSPWTAGHSERVTEKALEIGKVMGLKQDQLENLHRGALLHDIGKIGIPAGILDKPGKMTDEEYQLIQEHPGKGARILEPIAAYAHIIPMVVQHHEKFNGKGYPDGIAGKEISLGGRILAVADVFDALISDRPYREGMGLERTIGIIKEDSGTHFDPNVVRAFLKVIG